MNQPLTKAWATIARLQNARATSRNQSVLHALELMIDCHIDRIAANDAEPDDPAETRRAIGTAARRERHRARLVRLYLVDPASDDQAHLFASTIETACAARRALAAILEQTSVEDAALLLSVGQGEAPHAPGLNAAAARKRLSRLRARFSHLNLLAA